MNVPFDEHAAPSPKYAMNIYIVFAATPRPCIRQRTRVFPTQNDLFFPFFFLSCGY